VTVGYARLFFCATTTETALRYVCATAAGPRGNSPIFVASCHKNRDSPLQRREKTARRMHP
jgi:hypothetical protein